MAKGNTIAESLYFEISDAIDLLDNVTATTDADADTIGQAELALGRARDLLAGGALALFSEAPAMLEALRVCANTLARFAHIDDAADDAADDVRAILARIDATPIAANAGAIRATGAGALSLALMVGNPVDGVQLIGPFSDQEAAAEAADAISDSDWWIVPLTAPNGEGGE